MKVDLTTDVRIIAIQSAALRLENLTEGQVIDEPELNNEVTELAKKLRRKMNLLKLKQQTPGL